MFNLASFGDTFTLDNTSAIARLTEFETSILEPLELQLTGKKKDLVTRWLCAWTETDGQQRSKYLTKQEMYVNPLFYIPVNDERGNKITQTAWEEVNDSNAVKIVNEKGANYIIHELRKFFNDKIVFADISRDEAVNNAADVIDETFSYIIFNEADYEVANTTQLITIASNFQRSLYDFLSGMIGGKMRDAIVTMMVGAYEEKRMTQQEQESSGGLMNKLGLKK